MDQLRMSENVDRRERDRQRTLDEEQLNSTHTESGDVLNVLGEL